MPSKTPERKHHGSLATWLFENQAGISFSLVGVLILSHICLPSIRPFTSKFVTLGHYNHITGKYGASSDDFLFMSFCVVLFTGLRAGIMDHVLVPLARRWGVTKQKDMTRFAEQAWLLCYYNVFWPLGMVCQDPVSRMLFVLEFLLTRGCSISIATRLTS